jgi:hypothetical protein
VNSETLKRRAREKARMDMRDDAPNNPYTFGTTEYWAYANEVNKAFNEEELARSI